MEHITIQKTLLYRTEKEKNFPLELWLEKILSVGTEVYNLNGIETTLNGGYQYIVSLRRKDGKDGFHFQHSQFIEESAHNSADEKIKEELSLTVKESINAVLKASNQYVTRSIEELKELSK